MRLLNNAMHFRTSGTQLLSYAENKIQQKLEQGARKAIVGRQFMPKNAGKSQEKLVDTMRHSFVRESSCLINLPFSRDLRGVKKEVIGMVVAHQETTYQTASQIIITIMTN